MTTYKVGDVIKGAHLWIMLGSDGDSGMKFFCISDQESDSLILYPGDFAKPYWKYVCNIDVSLLRHIRGYNE